MIVITLLFIFAFYGNEMKVSGDPNTTPMLPGSDNWGRAKDPVNYNMGSQLFKIYFNDTCKTSDGRYLLACGLNMDTIYKTDTDLSSEVDTSTSDYTSDENTEIQGEIGGSFLSFKAKGSYSQSHQHVNEISSSESKTFITTKIRMQLYRVYTDLTTMQLSDEFKKYIDIMVNAIKANQPERYQYWLYEFSLAYPSTYISEIIVGGALVQNVFADDTFCSTTNKDVLSRSASASASFMGFGASGSYNYGLTQEQIDTFRKHTSHITTTSLGGVYYLNSSITDWQNSVLTEPSVLKYTVSDTIKFIVPELLPEYPSEMIARIRLDYEAIQKGYLHANTHLGCTYRNATNYKVWANVESDQCLYGNKTGSPFGGFYITNMLRDGPAYKYTVLNPLTGELNCAGNSTAHCYTRDWPLISVTVCLCLADEPDNTNYPANAGGYGTSVNQITGDNSCPTGFTALPTPMGGAICSGNMGQNGYFMGGGFITNLQIGNCELPNPYSSGCSCPYWAPWQFSLNTGNPNNYEDVLYEQITLCYGGSQFQPPHDPGLPIPYQGIQVPIYAINGTKIPTTSTPSPIARSLEAELLPISLGAIGVLLIIIIIIGIYVIRLNRRTNSYQQLA